MKTRRMLTNGFLFLAAASVFAESTFAQQAQPIGLSFNVSEPSKLVILPGGNFLTAVSGNGPNHGSVFFFDKQGDFTWILLGLPGAARPIWSTDPPSAPDGLAASGNTLFIATGKITQDGALPESTTLGSILRVTFSRDLASIPGPFFLRPSDYQTLLSGSPVTLGGGDNTATVSLLVSEINGVTDLSVDAENSRLYIVSRQDQTISWVPLLDTPQN